MNADDERALAKARREAGASRAVRSKAEPRNEGKVGGNTAFAEGCDEEIALSGTGVSYAFEIGECELGKFFRPWKLVIPVRMIIQSSQ